MLDSINFLELWVFPLHRGFAAWLGFTLLFLAGTGQGRSREIFRSVISALAVLYFFHQAGLAPLGAAVILLPPALWLATHKFGVRGFLFFLPLLLLFGFWGHYPMHVGPQFASELATNGRLSIHVLALFFFFRIISYGIATGIRNERATFFECIEYFFAPPFLLEPGKGFMTTFATFREPIAHTKERWRGLRWLIQGLAFQIFFFLSAGWFFQFLNNFYFEGTSPWRISWIIGVGFAAFLLTYIEKARMSYTLAGLLRLSGRAIEPDFNSPWVARNLLDYWRRFHYWVLEFYVESLYQPISYYLSKKLSARLSVGLGMLLTFLVGTAISHTIYYAAPFSVALALGFLFGLLTMFHYYVGSALHRFGRDWGWLGIPTTWLTVAFLYAIAYPVYGLGWGWSEIVKFFG